MMLDYTTKGRVTSSMYKMLTKIPSDMNGVSKIPAAGHLFNTNPDAKKLPEGKVQLFHHLVVKFLYLFRHTRQDIQTAVAFLCTRVKSQTKMTTRT